MDEGAPTMGTARRVRQEAVMVDAHGRIHNSVSRIVENRAAAAESVMKPSDERDLQSNSDSGADSCSICGSTSTIWEDLNPLEGTAFDAGLTCGQYEGISATIPLNSTDCQDIRQLFSLCCESDPVYVCEKRTRQRLLRGEDGYDSMAAPLLSYSEPLQVTVSLTMYLVTGINVQAGTVEVFVWLTLIWHDPRLAWTVNNDLCASNIRARASLDSERTEIWVPDFDVYNLVNGVHDMPDAAAEIYPDGTVLWERNGAIRGLCQFTGLSSIPFDTLGCQLLFGSWTRKGNDFYNFTLDPEAGFVFGDFSSTYTEYRLDTDKTSAGDDGAGILFFNLFFLRATNSYINNVIVPTTLLTYLSFGGFLLDVRVGERLSYGVALALVIVAQQIVTSGMLPVSEAHLWVEKYIQWSFYWVIFCIVESIAVGYIFFLEEHIRMERRGPKKNNDGQQSQQDEPEMNGKVRSSTLRLRPLMPINEAEEEAEEGEEGEYNEGEYRENNGNERKQSEDEDRQNEMDKDNSDHRRRSSGSQSRQQRSKSFRPRLNRDNSVAVIGRVLKSRLAEPPNKRFLRLLDRFCFFFAVGTYTVFIAAMFGTIRLWDDKVQDDWIYAGSTHRVGRVP